MTTAWRLENVGSKIESATGNGLQTTSSQYGDWSIAKPRSTPLSRTGFKPIGQKETGTINIKEEWKSNFTPVAIDSNNNEDNMAQNQKSDKLFQRVKPLDFSQTKFSPRQGTKSIHSDGVSFSVQSEPVIGGLDLTKEQVFGQKSHRKQVNFSNNSQSSEPNNKLGFSFEPRHTSPKAGRRAIIPPDFDSKLQATTTQKRITFSPRGPRKQTEGKMPESYGMQRGPQANIFLDKNLNSPVLESQQNNNNIKGATTDWSLTKYEITSGFPPRNTNAQVIAKIPDPSAHPFSARYLDSVPTMQRSHTFDYGDRKSSGYQPPSWQSKVALVSAGSQMPLENDKRSSSGNSKARSNKPSPKIGRRFPNNWNESYIETSSIHSIKSDDVLRKPGTPIYKHGSYMYKTLEKPTEIKSNMTNYNVFHQNDGSLFDTSPNNNSFNAQFTSLTNKTTDPTEFDYDDNLYTIAERSRENSRPTSETGSDTNSLDYLTSASNMNGISTTSHFSIDLTIDHNFPGKDQAPKKSILKKAPGLASAQYDLNKMFTAGTIEAPKQFSHTLTTDEQMSMVNSTTEKRKVTFNV